MATIRAYQPADIAALYDVCVRTGAAGADQSGDVDDPMLPGHLYVGPYVALQPELAFVVADVEGAAGYVVGTLDTRAFEARLEAEWFPALRAQYPVGSGGRPVDRLLISLLHRPPAAESGIVDDYPAHLHIDLLPRVQGQGSGRRLIDRFCGEVERQGARGVHFGVNPANRNALGFYEHLGFERLRADAHAVILGRRFERRRTSAG